MRMPRMDDRSFVATLGQGGESIIAATLSIGRSFGMEVVIEGVETELQRRQLTALGACCSRVICRANHCRWPRSICGF